MELAYHSRNLVGNILGGKHYPHGEAMPSVKSWHLRAAPGGEHIPADWQATRCHRAHCCAPFLSCITPVFLPWSLLGRGALFL